METNLSIRDIERQFVEISRKWGEDISLPVSAFPTNDGRRYIEPAAGGKIALVSTDRGIEVKRVVVDGVDDLLYLLFEAIAYRKAWDFELRHRDETQDSRRIVFPKAVELIGRLSDRWSDRMAAEQRHILAQHPFRDKNKYG